MGGDAFKERCWNGDNAVRGGLDFQAPFAYGRALLLEIAMSVSGKVTAIFGTSPNFIVHVEIASKHGQFPLVFRVNAQDHNAAKQKSRQELFDFGADIAKSFQENRHLK